MTGGVLPTVVLTALAAVGGWYAHQPTPVDLAPILKRLDALVPTPTPTPDPPNVIAAPPPPTAPTMGVIEERSLRSFPGD